MSITNQDILKAILLKELEAPQQQNSALKDPNTLFILQKYAGLKEVLIYLMTPSFHEYVSGIRIVAPKPTTFKIFLHNGQFFFLQFMGKAYQATIAGKNYYLMNIGEKERCMLAIARILRFGSPIKTKGPEGAEKSTREEEPGGAGGEETAEVPEATPEEGGEQLTEIRILEEILKKKLNEDADTETGKDTKKYEIEATNKLNDQIQSILKSYKENKKSITIVVNGQDYPDIVRAEVVPGSQNKSDIDLIDSKGTHQIFISHKDKGGPTRFARWGSIQYLFKERNKEVFNFRDNIYNYIKSLNNSGVSTGNATINKNNEIVFHRSAAFSQKISSIDLKNRIVFGKDFTGKYGLNNVQLVVQGDIVLKEVNGKPGFYEFDVNRSEKIWFNGKTPDTPIGEYEPVMHVHWREDSNDELDIIHGETMAKPIASVSGILWEAGETLNPNETYLPKDAIIVPKDQRKILLEPVKKQEILDILVSEKWKESFEKKMKDRHKKPSEYKKYFDTEQKTLPGYVRINPSFRKDFYFGL